MGTKEIKIPLETFLDIRYLLSTIQNPKEKQLYENVNKQLEEKYKKIMQRTRYAELLKADSETEKQKALHNYLYNKKHT